MPSRGHAAGPLSDALLWPFHRFTRRQPSTAPNQERNHDETRNSTGCTARAAIRLRHARCLMISDRGAWGAHATVKLWLRPRRPISPAGKAGGSEVGRGSLESEGLGASRIDVDGGGRYGGIPFYAVDRASDLHRARRHLLSPAILLL